MIELNRIYNESCLDTMSRMPDECIDLVLTSPPYDDMREYKGDSAFDFEGIAKELFRVIKVGGVLVWIVGDQTVKGNETGSSFRQALYFKEIGFNLFDTMIYEKSARGCIGGSQTYWQTFEYMFVLSKERPKTINLICDRKNKSLKEGSITKRLASGELKKVFLKEAKQFGRRTNIWKYHTGKGHSAADDIAFEHPAIFPERLAQDHVHTWSNESDLVYDPFSGSGTTALVCLLNNRNYVASEISDEYCQISKKRIDRADVLIRQKSFDFDRHYV